MIRETDYIKQLVEYFKKNLSKGYTADSLKWALIQQGYSKMEVEKAFDIVGNELSIKEDLPENETEVKQEKQIIIEKKPFWKKILGL